MSTDHPLLKFFILPLAHQLLQQEETLHCLAHGFLLIPLVTVSDHFLHPRHSPTLSAQAHPGVMEYSVPSFSFFLPKLLPQVIVSCQHSRFRLQLCIYRTQTNSFLAHGLCFNAVDILLCLLDLLLHLAIPSVYSPRSATCAWFGFHSFTTSSSGVSGVRIINMIYGPSCWPGPKSSHITGQDTPHFTPAIPSQALGRQ